MMPQYACVYNDDTVDTLPEEGAGLAIAGVCGGGVAEYGELNGGVAGMGCPGFCSADS